MAQESAEEPRDLYTIPISSSWFDWDEIHETERRSLPEFFDGSSISRNPRVYKEYRDFIISKYRETPSRRLTFTEVRKSIVGDVGSLHKVFLFLDRWGLINFGASKDPKGAGGDAGLVVVVEDGAPPGVQVVPAPTPPAAFSAPPVAAAVGENGFKLPPLSSYSDVFGDPVVRKQPVCGECGDQLKPGQHESVEGGFVKCSKCLEKNDIEQKAAVHCGSKDQTDADGDQVTNAWTDAETLLLLEAVLKHGEDWDLIAQHVRTKNKLECIGRLIQLPFGENMLGTVASRFENRSSSSMAADANSTKRSWSELPEDPSKGPHCVDGDNNVPGDSALIHPSKRRRIPFLDATDSLMKQVALLSTVAGSCVAAAAAEAAVLALCDENPSAAEALDIDDDETTARPPSFSNEEERKSDTKIEDPELERPELGAMPESVQENFSVMTFRMRAAIATALGAVAARAKLLADQEEREMELLMASIIETQIRKIQYKMKHFEELEPVMQEEYTQLQQLNESIIGEWASVLQQTFQAGIPRWKDHGVPKSLFNSIL